MNLIQWGNLFSRMGAGMAPKGTWQQGLGQGVADWSSGILATNLQNQAAGQPVKKITQEFHPPAPQVDAAGNPVQQVAAPQPAAPAAPQGQTLGQMPVSQLSNQSLLPQLFAGGGTSSPFLQALQQRLFQ
jgi:hypothetical protein